MVEEKHMSEDEQRMLDDGLSSTSFLAYDGGYTRHTRVRGRHAKPTDDLDTPVDEVTSPGEIDGVHTGSQDPPEQ